MDLEVNAHEKETIAEQQEVPNKDAALGGQFCDQIGHGIPEHTEVADKEYCMKNS
jgi:hypothetical protein